MSKIFISIQDTSNNFKSAHVAIIKEKKVLILKRSSTDRWMPNHYGLPGGKLDAGETPQQAACRECKEEANLEILPENLIFLPKISNNKKHAFYCTTKFSGNPKLDFEHSDFQWIDLDKLSKYRIVPDLFEILKEAFEKLEIKHNVS